MGEERGIVILVVVFYLRCSSIIHRFLFHSCFEPRDVIVIVKTTSM